MFNLDINQAVKVADKFMVRLNYGEYSIGENHTTLHISSTIMVGSIDNIAQLMPVQPVLKHYLFDGNMVSIAEYEVVRKEVDAIAAAHTDEFDEMEFSNLDEEFAYRKKLEFLHKHTPVYENQEAIPVSVKITVVGELEDTGSKFIESSLHIGKVSYGSGAYRVLVSGIAKDEFLKVKAEYPDVKIEDTTHSNIRFAKINENYIFSNMDDVTDSGKFKITTTLSAAKEAESEVRKMIRDRMMVFISPAKLNEKNAATVMKALLAILNSMRSIEATKRTVNSRSNALNLINKLINELREIVE